MPANAKNLRFREMAFLFEQLILATVTNHGSLLFYQRFAPEAIPIQIDDETERNIFPVDWSKISKTNANVSFRIRCSSNENALLLSNGHGIIHIELNQFRLQHLTWNLLPFIRSQDCVEDYLQQHNLAGRGDEQTLLVKKILSALVMNSEDGETDTLVDALQWLTHRHRYSLLHDILLDSLSAGDILSSSSQQLKIFRFCNANYQWIQQCLTIEINKCYDQMEHILLHQPSQLIAKFDWSLLFQPSRERTAELRNSTAFYDTLRDIMVLVTFEDPSLIINANIDQFIDILWRLHKLNHRSSETSIKTVAFDTNGVEHTTKTQRLKTWLDEQYHAMSKNRDDDDDKHCINKQEFARNYVWKTCSTHQQQLIAHHDQQNQQIIHRLIAIIDRNLRNKVNSRKKYKLLKHSNLKIYKNATQRQTCPDSDLEFQEIVQSLPIQVCPTPSAAMHTSNAPTTPTANDEQHPICKDVQSPKRTTDTGAVTAVSTAINSPKTQLLQVKSDATSVCSEVARTSVQEPEVTPPMSELDALIMQTMPVRDNDDPEADAVEQESVHLLDELSTSASTCNGESVATNTEEDYLQPFQLHCGNDAVANHKHHVNTDQMAPILHELAALFPQKCIIDQLAVKLTKDELIQLLVTKTESKINEDAHEKEATSKWKLVQYNDQNEIIANQSLSTKIRKKIKKYLRNKNQLLQLQQQRQQRKHVQKLTHSHVQLISEDETDVKTENAECSIVDCDDNYVQTMQTDMDTDRTCNLTTTITGDVSYVLDRQTPEQKELDEATDNERCLRLSMDAFDCAHIPSSSTHETQTSPEDILLNTHTAAISSSRFAQNMNEWFTAPLLSLAASQNMQPTEKQQKQTESAENEQKTAEIETQNQPVDAESPASEYVPVPVIGPRTAGLAFIDPLMRINKRTLQLQHETEDMEQNTTDGANNEDENEVTDKRPAPARYELEWKRPRQSGMECESKSGLAIDDFRHDIATMDVELSHLASICDKLQNNYYASNETVDVLPTNPMHSVHSPPHSNTLKKKDDDDQQLSTMQAWNLLQNIQQNLNNVDDEITAMNRTRTKSNRQTYKTPKHQLRKLKAKTKSRRRGKEQIANTLQQQTELLNVIYDNL